MALVLASKSPRRRELLALLTVDFEVEEAGVNEQVVTAETPAKLAKALAGAKAAAVHATRSADAVIGCDTVVDLHGQTLGKPKNQAEATRMLTALSGNTHLVHTGVCVFLPGQTAPASWFVETTRVTFAQIPAEEIKHYTASPEPYDKAGGYGIQGVAARFIPRIEGCYYNVMGLPVAALYSELKRLGIPL